MSSAVIYQNIAAATPFVAAIGIGAGLAFYLYFRYTAGCEEKQQARLAARAELNNIEYIIRRDLDALPAGQQQVFSATRQGLAERTAQVMEALEADDQGRVEQLLAELAFQSFEIRRSLEDAHCSARETDNLAGQLGQLISEQLPDCRDEDQAPYRAELEAATAAAGYGDRIARLEALLAAARRSARLRSLFGAQPAHAAEERFTPQAAAESAVSGAQQAEIERFHLLLKGYDPAAYDELLPMVTEARSEQLPQRLAMIRDMVRLRYGTARQAAAATRAYRSYLAALQQQLAALEGSEPIMARAAALAEQRSITREEYAAVSADAARHMAALREEAILIADMRERLSALGYNTTDGEQTAPGHDQPLFFDTRWDEYKVLVRIGANGELVTRLARIVASEREKAETTDYQRQRDLEVAHSWCKDFDSFIAALQQKGYAFTTVLRKEPEEGGVTCIVDAARAAQRARGSHAAVPQTRREQSLDR